MGYIMELRKFIGHRPIIMPSAYVILMNDKNEILLQKRSDNGYWGYPGGAIEAGESFEECAIREVEEETGYKCMELELFTTQSGKELHYTYPNGDEVYLAEIVFICKKYEGNSKCDIDEAVEQSFFSLEELPDNISPMNIKTIERLKQVYEAKSNSVSV